MTNCSLCIKQQSIGGFFHKSSVLNTALCYKVCQWLATGRWFSSGNPVSSPNKTDHHDITEILLRVALNTITLTPPSIHSSDWMITVFSIEFQGTSVRILWNMTTSHPSRFTLFTRHFIVRKQFSLARKLEIKSIEYCRIILFSDVHNINNTKIYILGYSQC